MKTIIIIFPFLINTSCFGQTRSEKEKVLNFKYDLLTSAELYKPDTIYTSSGLLTRERLPNVRRITMYPKNEKIKHDEYYYNDTKILESTHSYKLPSGEMMGLSKQYNKKGELEYVQNHDKGTWEVVKFDNYPYYRILVNVKSKVDSLIKTTYGREFFEKYVVWSPEGSAFYNGEGAGATWYDYQEWKPKEFSITYSIRVATDEFYEDQIIVRLDSMGQIFFPFNKYDDIQGFEKVTSKNGFLLNKKLAINKAKKIGLTENDTSKAFTNLTWRYTDSSGQQIFNGYFTYNVVIKTKTIIYKPSNGRSRIEYKFDVYVFNPWTGEFKERKKMKSFREWEGFHGLSTGLLPDN